MTLVEIVVIFGVDNSSSSLANNCKNNFLVLGEGPTFGINERLSSVDKNFTTNLI